MVEFKFAPATDFSSSFSRRFLGLELKRSGTAPAGQKRGVKSSTFKRIALQ
jgi:hypothetical protein